MIELLVRYLSDPRVLVPLVLVALAVACLRTVAQYEKGVVFRFGKLIAVREPGLTFLIPLVDRMRKVDLRVVSVDVARQETMTRDNVPAIVDAVIYYRIVDPERAILTVENAHQSTYLIAQTSLRSVIGTATLDQLLQERDQINTQLRELVDRQTLPWGVEVPIVEVKDVAIPESMKRAMAREAEVERDRRARLIQAAGEEQAAALLRDAARTLAEVPEAMHLRTLQALSEASQGRGKMIVLPIPAKFLLSLGEGAGASPPLVVEGPADHADQAAPDGDS